MGFFTSFAHPWILALLLPLVGVVLWVYRRVRTEGVLFSDASARFRVTGVTWRMVMVFLMPGLFCLGLGALIVAAAEPRTVTQEAPQSKDALACMLVADISGSMDALDFSPETYDKTRLDVLKETFENFIQRSSDDLIGLVTFGGFAKVRSPLTADHKALLQLVKQIEIPGNDPNDPMVSREEQQTAIGDGLSMALLRIKEAVPTNKIVILLSDGVHNAGALSPQEAAVVAEELGIKVYTVGIGKTGHTKMWGRDPFTQRRTLVSAYGELDEETLKHVAERTGGIYANVRSAEALEAAFQKIEALEKTRVELQKITHYSSQARPWLIGGCVAILFAVISLVALLRRPI